MRALIASDRVARVVRMVALASIAYHVLLLLPAAADPFGPVRGLVLGSAGLVVALSAPSLTVPREGPVLLALVALAVAIVGTLLAALLGGLPTAVFGVHGRFLGLVSGLAALVAFGVGIASSDRVRMLARLLALALVIESGWLLVQAAGGAVPAGSTGNQVLTGGWMVVALGVVAAGARTERGWTARLLWIAAIIGTLGLGLAGSRGAWVGFAAGLAVLMVSGGTMARRIGLAAGLAFLVAGAALAGGESLTKLDPRLLGSGSAETRLAIWRDTAVMVADHPWAGVGPGRYLFEFTRYQPEVQAAAEHGVRPDQAHSIPLHVAAESGIPTAVAAIVFVAALALAGWRRSRSGDAVSLIALAGVAAWCGQALFGISTIEADGLAFLLLGVIAARTSRVIERPGRRGRGVPAVASGGPPPATFGGRVPRLLLLAGSGALIAACGWYLSADVLHRRAVEAFYRGDMVAARALGERAVAIDPLVDIYRIGATDPLLYGAGDPADGLALVDAGLSLEPDSHDLLFQRARLLRASGAADAVVLQAHLAALDRYPLGPDIAHATIEAAFAAGDTALAARLADDVLAVYPYDSYAIDARERASGGP